MALGKSQFRALLKDYPYLIDSWTVKDCLRHIRERNKKQREEKIKARHEYEMQQMDSLIAKEIIADIKDAIMRADEVSIEERLKIVQEIIQRGVTERRKRDFRAIKKKWL